MLLNQLFKDPLAFALFAAALMLALSWHEAAHAYTAKKLGDDTAENLGRITLNPLAHLDPLGTIALLVAGFGWGKPVPVNPNNFRQPKLDNLKVALAGPLSNLALALLFAALNWIFQPQAHSLAANFTAIVIWFNLVLMFFNLIPLPPLDGSKVVHLFLDDVQLPRFEQIGYYLLFGLIALTWLGFPLISNLIITPTQTVYSLLTGGTLELF